MIILLVIILVIIFFLINNYENFSELTESQYIDYNVIHMKSSCNKKSNINKQMKKLNKYIHIFDAIIGKNITNLGKYDKNIKLNYKFKTKAELGCYLSHLMLIKKAISSDKKYTVVFEDDFKIVTKDLNTKILDITKKLDNNFDIIFLGNLYEIKSEKIIDNIYKKSNIIPLVGTHALLINNKNAEKIYKNLLNIDKPIDIALDSLTNENKLTSYVIYPSLVIQDNKFDSSLRPSYQILRRDIIQKVLKTFNKLFD